MVSDLKCEGHVLFVQYKVGVNNTLSFINIYIYIDVALTLRVGRKMRGCLQKLAGRSLTLELTLKYSC